MEISSLAEEFPHIDPVCSLIIIIKFSQAPQTELNSKVAD